MTSPVLVVGAGPVGLMAALCLAQRGVAVRIVDRLPARTNESRAAVIHARTLEHLEQLGLVDAFLEAGVRIRGARIEDGEGRVLAGARLDGLPTGFPQMLGLGQQETERLLTEALAALGVEVERPVELVALAQDEAGVRATLRHGDGTEELVETPYLLGCDGARGASRHLLGMTLEGETLDVTWATADVRMDTDLPADELIGIASEHGFGLAAPLENGRWRVVVDMAAAEAPAPETPDLATVQAVCDRIGLRGRLHDPHWISIFGVNTRLVPRMREGRAFLLGDAAHVHSPVGGQGMNTGVQDAVNLAWKLALVLEGRGTEALLDSFDAERHANARRVIRVVGPATKGVSARSGLALRGRPQLMRVVGAFGLMDRLLPSIAELDVHYRESPIVEEYQRSGVEWLQEFRHSESDILELDAWNFGKGPHAGERAMEAWGVTEPGGVPRRLYEHWVGDPRFQLLLFAGRSPRKARLAALAELAAAMEAEHEGLLRARVVLPPDVDGPAGALLDAEGDAHQVYGARYECVYLVRPDGYVGFRSQPTEEAELRAHLERLLARD